MYVAKTSLWSTGEERTLFIVGVLLCKMTLMIVSREKQGFDGKSQTET